MFSLIACIGKKRELGKENKLIFHIKEDMRFFRDTTRGHTVVMGRKTWESLPGKLPGRKNIVVSSHEVPGADETILDIDDFVAKNKNTEEEIFVIGGGRIYAEFLPYAKKLYLTEVEAEEPEADTYFPEFDKKMYDCTVIKGGKDHDLIYTFVRYQLK